MLRNCVLHNARLPKQRVGVAAAVVGGNAGTKKMTKMNAARKARFAHVKPS